jgi:threonylcarbamoyladenosine tRNA methylthiotransferase MtaB
MTGFAGETDEEFNETLDFVNKIKFSEAHVFQYSQRRGTPAARRPNQVSPQIKEERSKIIIEATNRSKNEFLTSHIGRTMEVLFETEVKDGVYEGKTANYMTVHAPSDTDISGKFCNVMLTDVKNGIIFGKIVD